MLTLQELQSTDEYEKVSIEVKVIKITIPETVGTGKRKQDVIVADGTATGKVTLWEEHIGDLEENASYKLQNFMVREWNATKYLVMMRECTEPSTKGFGRCSKPECAMLQRYDCCADQICVMLLVMANEKVLSLANLLQTWQR